VSPEVDPQNPQETTMPRKKPVSAKVRAAISKLRKDHQRGRQLLKDHQSGSRRWPDMKDVCKRFKRPAHQIRTLRAFAARYSGPDLERLCRQCEQHNLAIGLTAIRHLVKFDDRRKRDQFQVRLISQGWSATQTVAELKRALRPAWKGGRKPYVAADASGVLLQLQGFATSWRRWSDRFADADDNEVKVRPADLSGEVQAAMAKVTKAFKAISAAVSQPLEKSDGKDHAVTRKRR